MHLNAASSYYFQGFAVEYTFVLLEFEWIHRQSYQH